MKFSIFNFLIPRERLFQFSIIIVLCAIMSGCGVYKKYESQTEVPDNVYGQLPEDSPAQMLRAEQMSWREFFTDPYLQRLIDDALAHNTDLQSARIAVEQAQASLKAAKLAWLPSLSLNPQAGVSGTVSSTGTVSGASYTYNIPLQLDWNVGISNSVTVNKRRANAVLGQAEASREATQANIISAVAQLYYQLLLLDRQMDILRATDSLWDESLETQRALWENGRSYSTAVNQMESSNLSVKMQILDTERSIRSIENAICQLLLITPQTIARGSWESTPDLPVTNYQVPATALLNRPDVRLADHLLEEAFYNTAAAKAAFFPSFSLSGLLGWTNNGGIIADPGALLMQAAASLMQPIFQQGKLRASLKIAQLNQEDQLNNYVQTVINAGNQVNECLADCKTAQEKDVLYKRQVAVLQDAYTGTHELMDNGKASYLEVLTAQESLLSAQLNEATNLYNGSQALIGLYIALGGATK